MRKNRAAHLLMTLPKKGHHYSGSSGAVSPLLLIKGLIVVLLVVWMAVSLSGVFWRLLPQPELESIDASGDGPAFASVKKKTAPPVDVAALKDIALFGKEVEAAPVEVAAAEPVKEKVEATKLNLELMGSFASSEQKEAYAIIANGKKQELYRVSEEVGGLNNVKLVSVFSDKVILNNRGRQEALYMYPEGKPITSGSAVPSTGVRSPVTTGGAGSLANLSSNQRLEKISDAIRFSRKTQNGKMIGFRVLPGRNRAAFEETGLKLNDVVTAIDGQALDNLKVANQVYQEKRNATQASLTVLRGEEQLTIDVDLNNINVN